VRIKEIYVRRPKCYSLSTMLELERQELIEYILRALVCICTTRVFRKVFVQRSLMKRMRNRDGRRVINENIEEGRGTGVSGRPTSRSLTLNSSIPVKNNMIDIRQGQLITASKRLRYSSNRV
jgi:hypothetical protein